MKPPKSKNLDPFTQQRLIKFVDDVRKKSGQLATLRDFELAGFPQNLIDMAVKKKILEQFYVTLTNGTIVKTYLVRRE